MSADLMSADLMSTDFMSTESNGFNKEAIESGNYQLAIINRQSSTGNSKKGSD